MNKDKIISKLSQCKKLLLEGKLSFPKKVRMVEVGPRDGLQNEEKLLSVDFKVNLINGLLKSGLSHIEVGSFVSPKWVPQMASTDEVLKRINILPNVTYSVLVPNIKGVELALQTKANEFAVFTAASESFCKKNINCSIDESIEKFLPVISEAKKRNIKVRGYVSCVMGCPYEGHIEPAKVNQVAQKLLEVGCYEVSLGDTIGAGTPEKTEMLFDGLSIHPGKLAVHFHDTTGTALKNIAVALGRGVSVVDSSVGGLGGCPYANKRVGNVASERVLEMLEYFGIETGVNLNALKEIGIIATKELNREMSYLFN